MKTCLKLVSIMCLSIILVTAVAGCGSSKPSLVGKWQSNDDAGNYIQFTKDGNLVVDINNQLISGTYEILTDTAVKINVSGVPGLLAALFSSGTWEYAVTSTTLSLKGDRLTRNFTRVK
jgi:hypothetical protein